MGSIANKSPLAQVMAYHNYETSNKSVPEQMMIQFIDNKLSGHKELMKKKWAFKYTIQN